jgi:hypothetical protein
MHILARSYCKSHTQGNMHGSLLYGSVSKVFVLSCWSRVCKTIHYYREQKQGAHIQGLTITSRDSGRQATLVSWHVLDHVTTYISRFVSASFSVYVAGSPYFIGALFCLRKIKLGESKFAQNFYQYRQTSLTFRCDPETERQSIDWESPESPRRIQTRTLKRKVKTFMIYSFKVKGE